VKQGKKRDKWLLRNHLRSPYKQSPEEYVNSIWDHSPVLGFKTIRANHLLSVLNKELEGIRLIYIIRHPLACLASINRRQEFWNEIGWHWHWRTFLERLLTVDQSMSPGTSTSLSTLYWKKIASGMTNRNEQILFMWAISQQIALEQVDQIGGIITSYEALYMDPFKETQRILVSIGEDSAIHPSYLFEPSMTSMRTLHNSLADYQKIKERFPDFFWEDDISPNEGRDLLQIIKDLDINRPEILRYLNA